MVKISKLYKRISNSINMDINVTEK